MSINHPENFGDYAAEIKAAELAREERLAEIEKKRYQVKVKKLEDKGFC